MPIKLMEIGVGEEENVTLGETQHYQPGSNLRKL